MASSQDTERLRPDAIELVGGALCLDLANTVEGRDGPDRRDAILDVVDLTVWAERAGALSQAEAEGIAQSAAAALERSFVEVIALREAIYRAFTAIAAGKAPAAEDLAIVQLSHAEGMRQARLVSGFGDGGSNYFGWRWEVPDTLTLDLVRWRVSESAVDLLRFGRLDRLRQCPGGGEGPCSWLFIDTTRGGNRRWCSMSNCGSRSKWRRQNERRRSSGR